MPKSSASHKPITKRARYVDRRPLTSKAIEKIINKLPRGLRGYCIGWGWETFAREIERAHKIA